MYGRQCLSRLVLGLDLRAHAEAGGKAIFRLISPGLKQSFDSQEVVTDQLLHSTLAKSVLLLDLSVHTGALTPLCPSGSTSLDATDAPSYQPWYTYSLNPKTEERSTAQL